MFRAVFRTMYLLCPCPNFWHLQQWPIEVLAVCIFIQPVQFPIVCTKYTLLFSNVFFSWTIIIFKVFFWYFGCFERVCGRISSLLENSCSYLKIHIGVVISFLLAYYYGRDIPTLRVTCSFLLHGSQFYLLIFRCVFIYCLFAAILLSLFYCHQFLYALVDQRAIPSAHPGWAIQSYFHVYIFVHHFTIMMIFVVISGMPFAPSSLFD